MKTILFATLLLITSFSIAQQTVNAKLKIVYNNNPLCNWEVTLKHGEVAIGKGTTDKNGEVEFKGVTILSKSLDAYGFKPHKGGDKKWEAKGYISLNDDFYGILDFGPIVKDAGMPASMLENAWGLTINDCGQKRQSNVIIIAMLWSLSPAGESKVGIPYAIYNDVNIYIAFLFCLIANVIVYPFLMYFLDSFNRYFFRFKPYKKMAIYIARKAKNGAGKGVEKYGFWGLMIFVAVPLPGTGIWAGTIAAYIFKIERKKAFYANALGIFISALIIWIITVTAFYSLG